MTSNWQRNDDPATVETRRRRIVNYILILACLSLAVWVTYLHLVAIPDANKAATNANNQAGLALKSVADLRAQAAEADKNNNAALFRLHRIVALEAAGAEVRTPSVENNNRRVVILRSMTKSPEFISTLLLELDDLEQLEFVNTTFQSTPASIPPVDLEMLKKMPQLKVLTITGGQLTDDSLARLDAVRFPALIELHLNNVTLVGKDAPTLPTLPGLRKVSISQLKGATPVGLQRIGTLSTLTELELDETPFVAVDVLPSIGKLRTLKKLSLRGSLDFNADLFQLSDLSALAYLDLSNCPKIEGSKFGALPRSTFGKSLQRLSLGNNPLRPSEFEPLQNLASLISLNISVKELTDDDAAKLLTLRGLDQLEVHDSPKLTEKGIKDLGMLTRLKYLSLAGCPSITDDTIKHLTGLQNLERLNLSGTKLTGNGITLLTEIASLRELNITGITLSPVGFDSLAKIKSLQELYLPPETPADKEARQKLKATLPGLLIK